MTTDSASRVSIVIPTYDRAPVVGRAIRSALEQSPAPYEVVVVDDGSSDETPAVLAAFGDRIVVHRQPNAGASAARNAGIRKSRGALVGFLDSDDALLPGAIADGRRVLGAGSDGVLFSAVRSVEGCSGRVLSKPLPGDRYTLPGLFGRDESWTPPCGLFRRPCLERVGGFDEQLACGEDYLFVVQAVAEGFELALIRDPLFMRDETGGLNRLSASTITNMRGKLRALDRFEHLYPELARTHGGRIGELRGRYLGRLGRTLAEDGFAGSEPAETTRCLWAAWRLRPARLDLFLEGAVSRAFPRAYVRYRGKRRDARRERRVVAEP